MASQDNKLVISDIVKYETPAFYGREEMVIEQDGGASRALVVGDFLENGTGVKKVIVATGASCLAVLLEDVTQADNIAGDVIRVCLVRGPAVLDTDQVTCSGAEKAAAVAALAVLDITVRSEAPELSEGVATT